MEQITRTFEAPVYASKAFDFYFHNMKPGVLDIETTGLSPENSQFALGGLLTVAEGKATVRQFFAEAPGEERETLTAYLREVAKTDFLLTYNGKRFDLPYLRDRAGDPRPRFPFNLDLYLVLRGHSSLQKFLPNLKQKTVENFMGLWDSRADEISGAESARLYGAYVRGRDPAIKKKILLHNQDDVLQLYRLLNVLEKCDLHQAMYALGFPVVFPGTGLPQLQVNGPVISGGRLQIAGEQLNHAIESAAFEEDGSPVTAAFHQKARTFQISVPVVTASGMVLADLKALAIDPAPLEKYPGCGSGFLILEQNGRKQYREINHLSKLMIERILGQWNIRP